MPDRDAEWQERQEAIRKVLRTRKVRSQEDLRKRLAAAGFETTQSSLSRDLAEMRAVKLDGRYQLAEDQAEATASGGKRGAVGRIRGLVRSVKPAGPHLLVVRTSAGAAQLVAQALDQAAWPEVVGTVAGDDTIFIACGGRHDQAALETRLEQLLGGEVSG
ncbi:MAG: hypothetical protein IPK72_08445 [Candidatus Eisenbacteria bacterium]|nr:hypothetical protein [Candidatus Eisenbacteria bacterium]